MRKFREFKRIRTVLIVVAIIIALLSLFVSQSLVKDLSREEHSKMEVFAQAYRSLSDADEDTDLSLVLAVMSGNKTIPVIVIDETGDVKSFLNIEIRKADTLSYLNSCVEHMRSLGNSIKIYYDESDTEHYNEVCFDESILLNRLTVYPYIQMGVVMLFVLIAIFALLSFKKTEQNRVWVGLSKETAHQLGTPISSLMAWTELLKDKYDDELIGEMEKDVNRLQMVAERFSKIGSMPEPVQADMVGVLDGVIDYVEHRSPATVRFIRKFPTNAGKRDSVMKDVADILRLDKELTEAKADVPRITTQIEALTPWTGLDQPLSFTGTKKTAAFIGTFPEMVTEAEVAEGLAKHAPDVDAVDVSIIASEDNITSVLISCLRSDKDKIEDALRRMSFQRPPVSDMVPAEQIEAYDKELKAAVARIDSTREEIASYADRRNDIRFISDYFRMRAEKYEVLGVLAQTKRTFIIEGYVPEQYAAAIEQDLSQHFDVAPVLCRPNEHHRHDILRFDHQARQIVSTVLLFHP